MRDRPGEWAPSRLGQRLDALSDGAVACLAVWTVLCWVVATFDLRLTPFTVGWMLGGAVVLAVFVVRRIGARPDEPLPPLPIAVAAPVAHPPRPHPSHRSGTRLSPASGTSRLPALVAGAGAVLCLAAAAIAAQGRGGEFQVAWFFAVVGVAASGGVLLLRRRAAGTAGTPLAPDDRPEPDTWTGRLRWLADAAAVTIGLAGSVVSLFVLRVNDDDVYYINHAQWIDQFDRIPHRDVLLSNGAFRAVSGTGSPAESYTALQGGLARVAGVHAATVAYEILPAIFTFLAVWAMWRLMRSWAIRRPLLCLLLALGFLMVNAATDISYGMYFFPRFSEGKAVFVSWLVPTLFVLLTRFARDRRRSDGWLLVAGGIAAVGLTTSATFVVPLILAAGALPLIAARRWRALAAPAAGAVIALVAGYVGSRFAPPGGFQTTNYLPPRETYHAFLGVGTIAIVAGAGLWLGIWLVRDRTSRFIVLGAVIFAAVALAPNVVHALSTNLGVAGALKRLLWVAPVPALVGLLAGLPPDLGERVRRPMFVRVVGLAVTGIVAVSLASASDGATILSRGPVSLVDHPTWRAPIGGIKAAEQVIAGLPPGSEVLAPVWAMHSIALVSGSVKAVNPRPLYADVIPQPLDVSEARDQLTAFEAGTQFPLPAQLTSDLRLLQVDVVCIGNAQQRQRALLRNLGWAQPYRAGSLTCLRSPASATPAPSAPTT